MSRAKDPPAGKHTPAPFPPEARHLPAVPYYPDLELYPGAKGWIARRVPPWVAAWADRTPGEMEGQVLPGPLGELGSALSSVADELERVGGTIEDYCVEFRDAAGEERAVMVRAWRLAAGGSPVLVRLHEVTVAVQAQRQALEDSSFHGLIGRSQARRELIRRVEIYGPARGPVLITGETGTGKELVARALHDRPGSGERPFVALNCAAVSAELFESELFGHEKGAFTGALGRHRGRFERAHGGTLFLDEIGEMPLPAQAKLLRVLEQNSLERVGGEAEIPVDVRVIAATNLPLERAVREGRFRADLYHRLAVFRIHVAALRERKEDIPLLVDHFLGQLSERYGRRVVRLTNRAMEVLLSYSWPGNIRELKNALERIFVETQTSVIGWRALEDWVRERAFLAGVEGGPTPKPPIALPGSATQPGRAPDREELLEALERAGGNVSRAARVLGIHRATLYRHMKQLGLKPDGDRP